MTQASSHFAQAPANPYTPRAQNFAAQLAAEDQPAAQVQPAQPATPAPQVQPTTPAPQVQPAAPAAPATPVPQVQPAQPIYAPQPAGVDPAIAAQLQQANAQLQQENAQQREAIAIMLQQGQELAAIKQQQQLEAALGPDAFGELETVAPEDAQRIARATMQAMQPHLQQANQQAQQAQQYATSMAQQTQQSLQVERLAVTAGQVRAAHPDIELLAQDPAYNKFLQEPEFGMSRSRDTIAAEELRNGNAQYVVDMISRFKGTVPQAAQTMTVAPVQTATSMGVPLTPAQNVPQRTLAELNSLFQMRQMTHDEYRTALTELRAAQQA